jgi:transcriptional regulator with XRE-family HTH domain
VLKSIRGQIADAIKKGRESKGWSQRRLCNELEVSFSIISKWETGEMSPGGESLVKLIKKLDLFADIFPEYIVQKRDELREKLLQHENRIRALEEKLGLV